jgi:hypothetical protein
LIAKKKDKTPPKLTVYGVHQKAETEGFGFYNVTVLRHPRMTLHNGRLWLRVSDVHNANQPGVRREMYRRRVLLNVTNALHWNPWPSGRPLDWDDVTLIRLRPPPSPDVP